MTQDTIALIGLATSLIQSGGVVGMLFLGGRAFGEMKGAQERETALRESEKKASDEARAADKLDNKTKVDELTTKIEAARTKAEQDREIDRAAAAAALESARKKLEQDREADRMKLEQERIAEALARGAREERLEQARRDIERLQRDPPHGERVNGLERRVEQIDGELKEGLTRVLQAVGDVSTKVAELASDVRVMSATKQSRPDLAQSRG